MDTNSLALIALVVQIVALIGGAVWVASMLRSQIASLGTHLESLALSISELKSELKTLDDRLNNQEKQVLRMEVRAEVVEELKKKAEIAEQLLKEQNHGNH
jgi:predicted RNase H-like nuclease (RuvC/YqgF family)